MSLASLSGVGALYLGISPVNSRHTPFFGGLFDEAVMYVFEALRTNFAASGEVVVFKKELCGWTGAKVGEIKPNWKILS